jgi:hypothetical protein
MRWVTRERPKIDRIACPWLIKRFIDPQAEILYVLYTWCGSLQGERHGRHPAAVLQEMKPRTM